MPFQETRDKHKAQGTESIPQKSPDFLPTGDTYLKHRKFVQEFCNNGRKRGEAYMATYNIDNSRSAQAAATRLLGKNYIQTWIQEFEQEAFAVSTTTLGWGIVQLRDIVEKAKKDKRYKEAIVAIDNIMRYAGKSLGVGDINPDDIGATGNKGTVFVIPPTKPVGAPLHKVVESPDPEGDFNRLNTGVRSVEAEFEDVASAEDLANKEKELGNLNIGEI